MQHISVIGAGTMGNGIAHTFAQYGYTVHWIDISDEILNQGLGTIRRNLDRMVAKQKITSGEAEATLERIHTYTSLKNGVERAQLALEAATENEALKLQIFRDLDMHCPENTILATNTSSISITKIAAATQRPQQVIGMHFMNPVPIMKLVEIIKGYQTKAEVVTTVSEIAQKLDKIPVPANDYPGFVANRILMPMINEAIYSLYQGVAQVADIDAIMKLGMAHPMGPLQLADFIGLDVCLSIMNVLYDGFKDPKYAPCPLLVNMVTAGHKGIKSGMGFYDYSQSKKAETVAPQFL